MARKNTNTKEQAAQSTTTAAFDGQALMKDLGTKSAVIRHLAAQGHTRASIAKGLQTQGILSEKSAYQHVRNVLTQEVKKVADGAETAKS